MNKVIVLTDSTCDLSDKLIEEYNIVKIPLYVTFGGEIYKDGVDINAGQLFDLVKEKKILPKTSACSVGDFMQWFKEYLDKGYDVFYTGIGGGLSATFHNAELAKEELATDRIGLVNSANLSTGTGMLVLKAAKMAQEGKSLEEITTYVDGLVANVRSKFAIESLEYLHKGGRCSGVARFFGTMARLKPVIEVVDGKLDVMAKPIGKRKALQVMIDDIVANKDNIHLDCVMVTHAHADEEAVFLKETLEKEIPNVHIEVTKAGCVISSHCGKGTIGILYIKK